MFYFALGVICDKGGRWITEFCGWIKMYVKTNRDFRLPRGNNGKICGIFIVVLCGYVDSGVANNILVFAFLRVTNLFSRYLFNTTV